MNLDALSYPSFPTLCFIQAQTENPCKGTFEAGRVAYTMYEPLPKDFDCDTPELLGGVSVLLATENSVPFEIPKLAGRAFPHVSQQSSKHSSCVQVVRDWLLMDDSQYLIGRLSRPHVDEAFTGMNFDNSVTGGYRPRIVV